MRAADRRSKIRPVGLVAIHACTVRRWTGTMLLAGSQIDVVVARDTTDAQGQCLPISDPGVRMAGGTVAVFFGYVFAHLRVGRYHRGLIKNPLAHTDNK